MQNTVFYFHVCKALCLDLVAFLACFFCSSPLQKTEPKYFKNLFWLSVKVSSVRMVLLQKAGERWSPLVDKTVVWWGRKVYFSRSVLFGLSTCSFWIYCIHIKKTFHLRANLSSFSQAIKQFHYGIKLWSHSGSDMLTKTTIQEVSYQKNRLSLNAKLI